MQYDMHYQGRLIISSSVPLFFKPLPISCLFISRLWREYLLEYLGFTFFNLLSPSFHSAESQEHSCLKRAYELLCIGSWMPWVLGYFQRWTNHQANRLEYISKSFRPGVQTLSSLLHRHRPWLHCGNLALLLPIEHILSSFRSVSFRVTRVFRPWLPNPLQYN